MKKLLVVLFLLALTASAYAQSAFKAGGNYNADIVSHKLGKISYPSWEISYERGLCKKFSINGTYNYARRAYEENNNRYWFPDGSAAGSIVYGSQGYIKYDQTFIVEGRYYLKSNSSGIYFHLGIPFTYTISKWFVNTVTNQYSAKKYSDDFAISTIGGLGIKYPISQRFGIEMNMSLSPSLNFLNIDYGTSGFIKSGVRFFVALD
jgi:hypothetical protein